MRRADLLATPGGRRLLFTLLYVSEGAPIGFVWWAMPTLLRQQGLALASITALTSLATLPWILKFLAGPLLDASLRRGWRTTRWITVCQLAMGAALLPLLGFDWAADFRWLAILIVMHAVFAAVQDVGIDTLAIRTVPAGELGRINGWMQVGMLGGRAAVASGAVLLAGGPGGHGIAVLFVAALIWGPMLLVWLAVDEPPAPPALAGNRAVAGIFDQRLVLGIAIALTVAAGFEFFGVSIGPRLLDLGGSDAAVSLFFGVLAPAGLASGALLGGRAADRYGPVRGTLAGLGLVTLLITAAAAGQPVAGPAAMLAIATAVFVGVGVLTAASYALFMSLSGGRNVATRFSLLMAMTNGCEAWAGFAGGQLAARLGYAPALLILAASACISVRPLFMLARGPRQTQRGP